MAEPSVAAARLPVIGSTCGLVGVLPAPKLYSDRSGFDRVDRSAIVCRVMYDAARGQLTATMVNGVSMSMCICCLQPPR